MNLRFSIKRRMHGIFVFTLALALTVFAAACSTKPTGSMSPTDILKAYYDAMERKDIDAVKKYLSHGSMQSLEKVAKDNGMILDQLIEKNSGKLRYTPEFSNEKITGD